MSKLSKFESGPLSATFKKGYINADGDIGKLTLTVSYIEDATTLEMTFPQAISLAHEILRRCS